MKCKICGYVARSLPAMGAHYRKKHPSKMKRSSGKVAKAPPETYRKALKYCPECGRPF